MEDYFAALASAIFFGFAEPFQLGSQQQADQRCGKAAIVQAKTMD